METALPGIPRDLRRGIQQEPQLSILAYLYPSLLRRGAPRLVGGTFKLYDEFVINILIIYCIFADNGI
jgi:hypothetical protein